MQKTKKTLTQLTKYLLIGLTLFFFSLSAFGQQSKPDSLLLLLKKAKEDTNKVMVLSALCNEYRIASDFGKSHEFGTQALSLSKTLKWKKGEANAYNNLGYLNIYEDDYAQAMINSLAGLKLSEENDDKKNIAFSYSNIGYVYQMQKNNDDALKYFLDALEIRKKLGDKYDIGFSYSYLGNFFSSLGNIEEAMKYHLLALNIRKETGDKRSIADSYLLIGSLYSNQKDYDKALENCYSAQRMYEEINDKRRLTETYTELGVLFVEENKFAQAEKMLKKALTYGLQIGNKEKLQEIYSTLSALYVKQQNYKMAYSYHMLYSEMKDSLNKLNVTTKIANLQNQYQKEKEEKIRKSEEEKKEVVYKAEIKQQKIIIYSVSGGLVLIFSLAFFIFRGYRQKQKSNLFLADKNKIIEEKNKDITDSINYAKRIQQAKLPKRKEIYSVFPDSFVLFKPKDIVSGDFYYFHKNDKSVFIASVDCTGHGVPGAFMSMIGSEKLDDALAHSADTSEILSHLNKGIKSSLRQTDSDESTRDGMDIALCSVDTDTRVVKYAGANRPLWLIRNGQTVVEEIKATKKAIGGFTEDSQHFDTHEIKFEQGDTFYISTDGFADTFGGAEQKKVTTKRFKEILLSIQDKSLKEQEHHLDNFIEEWKGGTEQVDDILVIGVRL
ncbi:MAG: tetratricopeptide repeat protein [Bacteroidetes bacterium]|nr:tetratricopeptide repeat protein [Bacteroidota bacterium]